MQIEPACDTQRHAASAPHSSSVTQEAHEIPFTHTTAILPTHVAVDTAR
jgi:hypothetical protein